MPTLQTSEADQDNSTQSYTMMHISDLWNAHSGSMHDTGLAHQALYPPT